MKRFSLFALGFALALLVTGAIVLAFFQSISASAIPTYSPTAVVPSATPTLPMPTDAGAPTATPTAQPPTTARPSLAWRRDAGPWGACATLSLDEQGVLRYGDCHGSTVVAYLTPDELATYLQYVTRYASFQYSEQGGVQSLRLGGRGARVADANEQQTIVAWAAGVYARLMEDELRADREAQTRLALAERLGISTDAIVTVRVEAVTWPDACLGLAQAGQLCAQVLTPGYRVLLNVTGTIYEYRTDRLGLALADVVQTAPTHTPAPTSTAAPTASAIPTAPPVPTALPTAQPTRTPSAPTPTPTLSPKEWIAEYYASRDLTGQPVIVRNEKQIAFDWWNGSPDPQIGADRFSLRLTREVDLEPGLYRLWLSVDDGVRVYVDDELVLDAWKPGEARQFEVKRMLKGEHSLVVEYFEEFGAATLHFNYEKVGEYDGRTAGPTGVTRPMPTRTPRIHVSSFK